jgi:capsid portal protein
MKKKNNTEISVIHLAEFNLPAVTETANKDYIQFGTDNLYPQYLLELYNGSSINNAVIKGVSAMIYGEGLEATDREDSDEHKEQWLRLTSLLRSSQKDLLKCLAFDLKLFGMCYLNVVWNKPRTKIVEMYHIPAQYIRSGKTDGYGNVNEYYYSADWSNLRKHKTRTYKAFNEKDRTDASQVLCIKDYSPGSYYYSLPDYQGSTSYIQLDMEIAQFHLSNIKSGMFPSMAVNFANGIPTREERQTIERQINSKFGGSGNAGKILITFNDGKDTAPEIVPINSNDNADSYQFLSTETTRKVLTGHRCTSPLLFGVNGNSSFGNNADELRDSYSLFNNTVIKPFQNTLLEGLEPLFAINDISLDLYFKSLKPADFIDIENVAKVSEDEQEKEGIDTGDEIKKEFTELSDDEFDSVLDNLNPEIIDEEWEVVEEREQGGDEGYEDWANRLIQKREDFADYIESKPSGFSYLDKSFYKIRFKYAVGSNKAKKTGKSRKFCIKMMNRTYDGKVYRIEDIDKASREGVNKQLGHKGRAYDLFKFKGGIYCRHKWKEVLYRLKKSTKIVDGEMPEYIGDYKTVGEIPSSYKPKPRGINDSRKAPVNMPDQGAYPTK